MPYYAQIADGRVAAVTETSAAVDRSDMVQRQGFDVHLIGYGYKDGVFTPPAAVVRSVTNLQARLALMSIGKLSAVEAAIDAMSEPQKTAARQTWDFAGTVDRDHPLVVSLGPVIGLDAAALDALFVEAAKL